jgi:hypothetical protein
MVTGPVDDALLAGLTRSMLAVLTAGKSVISGTVGRSTVCVATELVTGEFEIVAGIEATAPVLSAGATFAAVGPGDGAADVADAGPFGVLAGSVAGTGEAAGGCSADFAGSTIRTTLASGRGVVGVVAIGVSPVSFSFPGLGACQPAATTPESAGVAGAVGAAKLTGVAPAPGARVEL